uniref:Uncharacterized protein n=2 Tax=Cacopsylla melanoneura TaxID=428564 RepID=A0A8D8PSX8_9HEMI
MLLFGGERGGNPNNELWRFHFGTLLWEKISTEGVKPHPRSESVALIISELLFSQNVNNSNYGKPAQSPIYQNNILPLTQKNINILDKNNRSNFDTKRKTATTPNSCNLNILKEISKLSQKNLPLLTQNRCSYSALSSNDSNGSNNSDTDESPPPLGGDLVPSKRSQSTNLINRTAMSPMTPMTNRDITTSFHMTRDNSSVPNFNSLTLLTPVEVTKLVYLDGEEAPMIQKLEDFSSIHQRFHPNNTKMNRRSYPSTGSASVRFGNPITTPEETSDYASLETVNNNEKLKSQRTDSVKSFSNPNYMGPDVQSILSKKKEYNKVLNSPADSVLEDRSGRSNSRPDYIEMKPVPPRSLSLAPSSNHSLKQEAVRRRNNRCSSAGRYEERHEKPPVVTKVCIFLIGGKEQGQVTVFRRPLSIWKLSLPRQLIH